MKNEKKNEHLPLKYIVLIKIIFVRVLILAGSIMLFILLFVLFETQLLILIADSGAFEKSVSSISLRKYFAKLFTNSLFILKSSLA